MKFFIGITVCFLFCTACKKETTSSVALTESLDTSAIVKFRGIFSNGSYGSVTGFAKIVLQNNQYKLQLDSFMTTNGPDLKVYLSQEIQPINFVNIGSLKSTNGTQLYNIPAGVNYSEYKYALIHCQQYNHLFGSAELKP